MKKSKKSKKKRANNRSNIITQIDVASFSEEGVAQAIVKAYKIIEDERKEKEELDRKEWKRILGEREYPKEEKWCLRKIHSARNYWVGMWKLLFFKREDARKVKATICLMKLILELIFGVCKGALYFVTLSMIISIFLKKNGIVVSILIAFFSWFVARIFRIAEFEIEKIQDDSLVVAIFSGGISFVALVVAIITIIVA